MSSFGPRFWRSYAIYLTMYAPIALLFYFVVYPASHVGGWVFLVSTGTIAQIASTRTQRKYWPVGKRGPS